MARTVLALYDNSAEARSAVQDLIKSGFDQQDIILLTRDTTQGQIMGQADQAAEGAGIGAGIGAVVGGLGGFLISLGALPVPGFDVVMANGPVIAALAGTGIGAGAGAITGALVGMGAPKEEGQIDTGGVRQEGTLVVVRTSKEMASQAVHIMEHHHPANLEQRAGEWQARGWIPFQVKDEICKKGQAIPRASVTAQENPVVPAIGKKRHVIRKVEVDVERTSEEMGTFSEYEEAFRRYFQRTYGDGDYTYDAYLPAYQYGYDLARSDRFGDQDWVKIEPEVREMWEQRNPGTWEDYKGAIYDAWYEVRGARERTK